MQRVHSLLLGSVKKSAMKSINYDKMIDCNINGGCISVDQKHFVSNKHKMFTINKHVDGIISRGDDKRIMDGRILPLVYTVPIV